MADWHWLGNDAVTPGDFSVAGNWLEASVPTSNAATRLFFDYRAAASLTAGLNQSARTVGNVFVDRSFSASLKIGNGAADSYLQIAAAAVDIGTDLYYAQTGAGASELLFDLGATACVFGMLRGPATGNNNRPPCIVKGSALTVNAAGGVCGIGQIAGETATAAVNLRKWIAGLTPTVYLGAGVTVAAAGIDIEQGTIHNYSDITVPKVAMLAGTYNNYGAGDHTLLNVDGGAAYFDGIGDLVTGRVGQNATLSYERSGAARTITEVFLRAGANLLLNNGVPGSVIVAAGAVKLDGCRLDQVRITSPRGVKIGVEAA